MDAQSLLRLEAQTIWGLRQGRLGSGTVTVTTMTYDGQVETMIGQERPAPDTPLQPASAAAGC